MDDNAQETDLFKELIHSIVGKFLVRLLSSIYNIDHMSKMEGTEEEKLRHIITMLELRFWGSIESKIDHQIEIRSNEYTDTLKRGICEGMNIECGESTTIADLFKCIDVSVTDRISKALHLRNVARRHPLHDTHDYAKDVMFLEKMIERWMFEPYRPNSYAECVEGIKTDYSTYIRDSRKEHES